MKSEDPEDHEPTGEKEHLLSQCPVVHFTFHINTDMLDTIELLHQNWTHVACGYIEHDTEDRS